MFSCKTTEILRDPRHYAAASLKRTAPPNATPAPSGDPRHYAAASLKHLRRRPMGLNQFRDPRHYAAASLKPEKPLLIQPAAESDPRHYAAASLKLVVGEIGRASCRERGCQYV